MSKEPSQDLVALDDALKALAEVDARKEQVVEMRFFGGLSVEETAEALQVSTGFVMRDWRLAKVWLLRELKTRQPYRDASGLGNPNVATITVMLSRPPASSAHCSSFCADFRRRRAPPIAAAMCRRRRRR